MQRSRSGWRVLLLPLFIDLMILAACVVHIPDLLARPRVPFEVRRRGEHLVVIAVDGSREAGQLRTGDRITSFNGIRVAYPQQIDMLANPLPFGASATLSVVRGGTSMTATISLVPFYERWYIAFLYLLGLVAFAGGVYVLLRKPGDVQAALLHWSMVSLACAVIMAWEGVTDSVWMTMTNAGLFFGSYLGVASTFFLFTTVFPQPKLGRFAWKGGAILLPAVFVFSALMLSFREAVGSREPDAFGNYLSWLQVLHSMVLIYIPGGLASFVHSYVTSRVAEDRKKLQWILWSLCTGPSPFLLLTLFPSVTGAWQALPEMYTLPFLLIVPVGFAIAVVRHRVLDITVLINRTTVYAIVLTLLVGVYLLVAAIVALQFPSQPEGAVLTAIIVALLFEPSRRWTQSLVDRRFFKVRYDFREAQRRLLARLNDAVGIQNLADILVRESVALIPVERIGFFRITQPSDRIRMVAHRNFDMLEQHGIEFRPARLRTPLTRPVALADHIESEVEYEPGDRAVFNRWAIAIVFPVLSQSGSVVGFLVLGPKKSGERFSLEDVDLLRNIILLVGRELERFSLHHELVLKTAEAERLAELNELKSDFVSYVSHELRTPLTSIKMFTELLAAGPRKVGKRSRDYLEIIEGETDRLNRMVTTILDSAQIERGPQFYRLRQIDLRSVADTALRVMSYQLRKDDFTVRYRRPRRAITVQGDHDALVDALVNLIGNAIKYSVERKSLTITTARKGPKAVCSVKDRGLGISPEALPHIFEKYYRDPLHSNAAQGIGLGLPLVKHIMDGHNGTITVHSEVGKGTAFTLIFPINAAKENR